jgi:uncharacterized OsmC-like protein/alpha/beta superfamily hydrolase
MKSQRLRFPGPGGNTLAARLDEPDGEPVAYALFAHCFTCSKDLTAASSICRELAARAIAVLRFDFTGIGASEGEFAETNFSSNLDDLLAAADFLRRERQAPRLLVGHSLGGTATLAVAPRIPEAVAVATLGAPSGTRHLRGKLLELAPELAGGGPAAEAEIDLGGVRPVRIRRQLLDDLDAEPVRRLLSSLHRALLLFHSPADNVVGIDHARRLFLAARHPKSFVSLGTADHLLSDPRDARFAGSVLAAWAERYLQSEAAKVALAGRTGAADVPPDAAGVAVVPAPAVPAPAGTGTGTALERGEVLVSGQTAGAVQEVRAGPHRLLVDEPVEVGGGDHGPNPYDLILAALGACTSLTLRMYAALKKWSLTEVRVRLRHSRVHAADCADCAGQAAKLDHIDVAIELQGDLTAEQRTRLLEIAERCPVHRTLTSQIEVDTHLVQNPPP